MFPPSKVSLNIVTDPLAIAIAIYECCSNPMVYILL